jgi:hypothetical protein
VVHVSTVLTRPLVKNRPRSPDERFSRSGQRHTSQCSVSAAVSLLGLRDVPSPEEMGRGQPRSTGPGWWGGVGGIRRLNATFWISRLIHLNLCRQF